MIFTGGHDPVWNGQAFWATPESGDYKTTNREGEKGYKWDYGQIFQEFGKDELGRGSDSEWKGSLSEKVRELENNNVETNVN